MNILVSKSELSRAITLITNIVEKKTTMPIMSNVLISAEEGTLKLSGSDLEISTVSTIPAKVKHRGSTTVSARMFADIVRELPEGDVHLVLGDGERLEISSKNSKLRIIGVSAQEYPSLPGLSIEPKTKVPARILLEMIQSTIYAVSTDETRYNLNGVCFEIPDKDGTKIVRGKKGASVPLRLVATDGHRLAFCTRMVEGLQLAQRVIAPRKGLSELKKLLEDYSDTEIGFEIIEGFIVVETPNTKFSMRLVDGEFPDYNRAIPEGEGTKVLLNTIELTQALRRVALVVSDKQKCVRFSLKDSTLQISSSSPELGDAYEEIPVNYKGAEITIGFNAKYILDIAQVVPGDQQLVMELHGDSGPGRFTIQGDEATVAIVMPMRIV